MTAHQGPHSPSTMSPPGAVGATTVPPRPDPPVHQPPRFGWTSNFASSPPPLLLSFALGALCVAGFAPLGWSLVPMIALAEMIVIWARARSPRYAAAHGFAFGLGLFGVGVSWVYVSLADFGGMPWPLAALATALFCSILALYPAAIGYLQARLGGRIVLSALLVTPALWTLGEWMRDTITGFPWLAFGYAQLPHGPLAGYAPIVGVYGVSFCMALTSGLAVAILSSVRSVHRTDPRSGPAEGAENLRWRAALKRGLSGISYAIAVLALFLAGQALRQVEWTEPAGLPLKVALLQGNIAQDQKFVDGWYDRTLATYRELAFASDARLIVWPETAIPRLLHHVDPDLLEDLRSQAAAKNADMLIGIPFRDVEGSYYNSMFSFGVSPTQAYSKTHLVPFGEFIPAGFDWILAILQIPLANFSPGSDHPKPLEVAGQKVAINLCYEDVFGAEIIRQLPAATLLVNASNVAWFGHSMAPAQHLQISQMRALESGRPMLRATNTGMTAAIDAKGIVLKSLPQFVQGALVTSVQPRSGATPFVLAGNAPVVALSLLLLALGYLLTRRNY